MIGGITMTATKNINVFQRYVMWILDKLMNNITDNYDGFEDSSLWNIRVVYQANDLKLNRNDSRKALTDILNNPAYTDDWTTVARTPRVLALQATDRDLRIGSHWCTEYYGISVLHMNPYQAIELCKSILFDMICSYTQYGFIYGSTQTDFDNYIDTNCKMFAFLAYQYATANHTSEPELYDKAKRLVKSLNKRYVEIMTL